MLLKRYIKKSLHPLVWERLGQAKQEFKWSRKNYHCEEILIPVFKKYFLKTNGFYVDIGSNDGRSSSNTYHLEKSQAWTGILVEPIMHVHFRSRQIRDLKRNIFFNCALVDNDYDKKTVELLYSGLMTVTEKNGGGTFDAKEWAGIGSKFLSRGEVVTKTFALARTLQSVLLEANAPDKIDLLSIDVEGAELSVLQGLNFSNWIFEYILIETTENSAAFSKLIEENYLHVESINQNLLFMHKSMIK
jgi:FkbM family methyltransferase